jgi:hypothetical protein
MLGVEGHMSTAEKFYELWCSFKQRGDKDVSIVHDEAMKETVQFATERDPHDAYTDVVRKVATLDGCSLYIFKDGSAVILPEHIKTKRRPLIFKKLCQMPNFKTKRASKPVEA